jgi:transcriptional regulator with XRE-family HTH domain
METKMSEPGPEKLGALIRQLRCTRRWSQNQLGKLVGVGSADVTSVENGEVWPTDHLLEEFAALFGVRHEYLRAMLGPKPRPQPRPPLKL